VRLVVSAACQIRHGCLSYCRTGITKVSSSTPIVTHTFKRFAVAVAQRIVADDATTTTKKKNQKKKKSKNFSQKSPLLLCFIHHYTPQQQQQQKTTKKS
jgi:hypothetical protein